ncbi:MAG: redoxin domain-containing protein [Candidatus Poribacteria bacterium]|nr:redoxin domain-containing protein [Candidatus Poribacteria bacterium]
MMRFIETLYADPLLKFLVDTTLKSLVIFAVAGLFAFCLRRKSAAVRGFVWSMAIVGCLIVPLFSFVLPKWELGILPAEAPVSIAQNQLSPKPVASIPITPTALQPNLVTDQSGPLTALHWTDWMAIVWAGAGLFLLIRLIVGIGAVWHISARGNNFSRAADQCRSNWNQRTNVRLSDKITVPMVWGFLRPVILLPVDADQWQTERLRAVLLHELAHIKRWDWTMQMVTQITCAVYWFNPLVWFSAHRIRIEAEQACDDQVLNAGYQSTNYAQLLLDITRNVKIAKVTARAAVAIARSSKIERRLRTVLAENLNRHPVTKVVAGIGLLIFIGFAVPMGTMRLTQAANTEEVLHQQIQETPQSQPTPEEVLSKPKAHSQNSGLKQDEKHTEICTQNLLAIGKAIQAFQKEHNDFPEWLSDLHPKYLPDANSLICPADTKGGKPLFLINADPKMPVSYGYQFHTGYRERTRENLAIYGDVIPLARCRHHTNQSFACLNLSFSFKVYQSSNVWEQTPEEMYGTPEETITALEAGLQQQQERQQDNEPSFNLYFSLVRLYIEVGRQEDANRLINRFKSAIKPDDLQAHFLLRTMLEMANRDEEVLAVFEKLEERYPDNYYVLDELARIHEELGNSELAEKYRKKVNPMSELVGKVVPDFTATDLDGKPISLQQYRGKVILLDFWAIWCGFCLAEMPNVKRVYDTYKDQGFDIIGVNLDTDERRLRNYLKENDIQWRQIFSGQKWKSPLVQQYHIRSIPAPCLIAKDGTLISSEARGVKLEQLVAEALKDKTGNE